MKKSKNSHVDKSKLSKMLGKSFIEQLTSQSWPIVSFSKMNKLTDDETN